MPAGQPVPSAARRRGPRPRHTRQQVIQAAVAMADAGGLDAVTIRAVAAQLGAGTMSLYNYVPDKQTLVYDMVEQVSTELRLPEQPSGEWRADLHMLGRQQRALVHRHPWLITALSHRQPLGPATLAVFEFALAALEPTGLDGATTIETVALLNGFVINLARAELADLNTPPDPAEAAALSAQLQELTATGRYPKFAAALAHGDLGIDMAAHFDRLFDRIIDGLIQPAGPAD